MQKRKITIIEKIKLRNINAKIKAWSTIIRLIKYQE